MKYSVPMRVQARQRIVTVLKGERSSSAFTSPCPVVSIHPLRHLIFVVLACLHLMDAPAAAQSSAPAASSVSPADQSVRDDERLRILRDELGKSEQLADALAGRKAERLARSDPLGADEVQAQRERVLGDIAALQREINATHPVPVTAKVSRSTLPARALSGNVSPANATGPAATGPALPAPWWDVYGKTSRSSLRAPISLVAPPPVPTDAPNDLTPRME